MRIRTLTTDYMESHCYLLIEDGHTVVIDPGDASLVRRAVAEESVAVDLAILTHEHCDHVIGCSEVRDAFQCRMISSRTCNENLMDNKKNFSRYFNALVDLQSKYRKEIQKGIAPFTTHADEVFDGEMSISWMGHTLYLRETPGHSPGSICILLDENFLLSGDTLMRDDDTGTQFIGGSKKQLREITIPWLRSLPEGLTVYPGHGDAFRLGDRLASLMN